MDLSNLPKLASFIGLALLAIYSFYTFIIEVIGNDFLLKLPPNQIFFLIIFFTTLLFIIVISSIIIAFKKESTTNNKKVVNNEKNWNLLKYLYLFFGGILIIISLYYIQFFLPKESAIYIENFTTKQHENVWRYGSQKEAVSELKNGNYILTALGSYGISRRINIDDYFDYSLLNSDSYEISARLKLTSKNIKAEYGLQWAANSYDNACFSFLLNGKGQYSVQIFNFNNSIRTIVDWKDSPVYVENKFNILKIKQSNENWDFFLNSEKLLTIPKFEGFGNETGIYIMGGASLKVDWFKVLE